MFLDLFDDFIDVFIIMYLNMCIVYLQGVM